MIALAELIATLRFAGEVYLELADTHGKSLGEIDLAAASKARAALAADLESASGSVVAALPPVSEKVGDWREGTSAADLVEVVEREILRLAELVYMADVSAATKAVLERVDEETAEALRLLEGVADDFRANRDDKELAAAAEDEMDRGGSTGADSGIDGARGEDGSVDLFPVWYGTNRAPIDPKDLSKGFAGRRSQDGVRYGLCQVNVPKSHRLGLLGSGLLRRIFTGDDRLSVHSRKPFPADEFWRQVNAAANDERRGRHAVVFVHGYNVAFDEAALRTAQLGVDLGVNGLT